MQFLSHMLGQIKTEWRQFKDAPAGARFVQFHERHSARPMPLLKAAWFFAAVFCAGMGLLLSVTSGLGLLFLAVAAALLPAESRTVAALFDHVERAVRWGRGAIAAKRRSRTARLTTIKGRLDKDELERAVRAAAASEHRTPAPTVTATPTATDAAEVQPIRRPTAHAAATPVPRVDPAPRNVASDQKVVWITPPPPKAAARQPGTMKIWSAALPETEPQPLAEPTAKREPAREPPKNTIVMFPPPVHVASSESRRRTGDDSR